MSETGSTNAECNCGCFQRKHDEPFLQDIFQFLIGGSTAQGLDSRKVDIVSRVERE